jgi:hypothetical protein
MHYYQAGDKNEPGPDVVAGNVPSQEKQEQISSWIVETILTWQHIFMAL